MLNNKELECNRPLAYSLPACSTERSASTKRKETNMLKKIKKIQCPLLTYDRQRVG